MKEFVIALQTVCIYKFPKIFNEKPFTAVGMTFNKAFSGLIHAKISKKCATFKRLFEKIEHADGSENVSFEVSETKKTIPQSPILVKNKERKSNCLEKITYTEVSEEKSNQNKRKSCRIAYTKSTRNNLSHLNTENPDKENKKNALNIKFHEKTRNNKLTAQNLTVVESSFKKTKLEPDIDPINKLSPGPSNKMLIIQRQNFQIGSLMAKFEKQEKEILKLKVFFIITHLLFLE